MAEACKDTGISGNEFTIGEGIYRRHFCRVGVNKVEGIRGVDDLYVRYMGSMVDGITYVCRRCRLDVVGVVIVVEVVVGVDELDVENGGGDEEVSVD